MTRVIVIVAVAMSCLPAAALAWEQGGLRLRGRLQTRFEVEREREGSWSSGFRLRRARFDARFMPSEQARLVLELDGAEVLELGGPEAAGVELKDAYGRYEVRDAFRVQVGRFKKPFSRLKMSSSWELPVPVRGLLNRHAVGGTSHGGFGGRDIGLMIFGRMKGLARLRYYVGAFGGDGLFEGRRESHKDFVARLQVRPFKGLRVAVDATHKLYHDLEGRTRTANLFGADARLRFRGFTLLLEGAYGDNVDAGPGRVLWGVHAIASYRFGPWDGWALTPAAMVESFDPDAGIAGGRALRFCGAVNLDVGEIFRLILFAESSF
ncbi:MAG: hypothetical protein DRP90_06935, partial [Planctomycetota bacterium]